MQIEKREDFPKLLDELRLNGYAAEIGVARGDFSAKILQSSVKKLYSIDCWDVETPSSWKEQARSKWTQEKMDALYEEAQDKLRPFGERSEIIKAFSADAVNRFKDGYFDFIYLDASHEYVDVKEDISLWWSKVKRGGILAGHDYFAREDEPDKWGVIEAVDEHVLMHNLQLHLTQDRFKSWYVFKRRLVYA